ncbi:MULTISPECIES: type 2 periplasmic-binding domain-containing protein [Streptomycetaceae]|uniref:Uncharacterized protein n=1 Tax=Streptantibioticus cattleyicolor (strain ATCC 35852 / DSM 46488 / JCM 4925 / NBRC 14057 / NRRL 8057) TaxID=1003195 RepID=F8JY48_STREN|nr:MULTISPECIES: hypothetical protein [Streptomycetaceae]AEW94625.1 hypothetical protein SCATT_22540 [Streptantibioticus cattleyicolor NRRL 8057 = DSM 46488]MYS59262.1 hypothetical protein [Streptomyces sp. SID5468]CCB74981.1 protein of unknown function [Streptantibioticus cattleyicolor NRRL 8057 = DSM 46488]
MSAPARCAAAHQDDPVPCEGPHDAVRVVDQHGAEVGACVHHGARLYASLIAPRVYPGSVDGAAIEVYQRARALPPFPWTEGR